MNGRNYGEKNHDEQYEKQAAGCSGLRTDPAGRGKCICPVAAGSTEFAGSTLVFEVLTVFPFVSFLNNLRISSF